MTTLAPVLYLPHGGGPMPLLGDPAHHNLIEFLKTLASHYKRPDAIVLISGHWEAAVPSVTADPHPALLFDYYGFPPETYKYSYPAPGHPQLATEISALVKAGGFDCQLVSNRGYDHGMFVPMMLLYPEAKIPCIQLSLIKGLNAAQHIRLGECLASLREKNIMIVGSGMSFHNLQAIFAGEQPQYRAASDQFDKWLVTTLSDAGVPRDEQQHALENWDAAPYARFAHPREEHLLPLHVCFGAAKESSEHASVLFNEPLMGHRVAGFGWS
ncbi:MAG: class III extradiol ring-cleavage dioxygenase [Pseudomonadota bacterium]